MTASRVMNIFIANPFLDQETYQIITRNVTESKFREPGDNTRQLSDPILVLSPGSLNMCDRICKKGSYTRNYKYLEIPI